MHYTFLAEKYLRLSGNAAYQGGSEEEMQAVAFQGLSVTRVRRWPASSRGRAVVGVWVPTALPFRLSKKALLREGV